MINYLEYWNLRKELGQKWLLFATKEKHSIYYDLLQEDVAVCVEMLENLEPIYIGIPEAETAQHPYLERFLNV